MGSCFSQEGRRRHERLYERNDDYFFELEKQDSVKEKNSKWLDNEIGSSTRTATIQGSSEQFAPNRQNSLEDHWTLQSTSTFDYSFSFATLSQPDNCTHRPTMPQNLKMSVPDMANVIRSRRDMHYNFDWLNIIFFKWL